MIRLVSKVLVLASVLGSVVGFSEVFCRNERGTLERGFTLTFTLRAASVNNANDVVEVVHPALLKLQKDGGDICKPSDAGNLSFRQRMQPLFTLTSNGVSVGGIFRTDKGALLNPWFISFDRDRRWISHRFYAVSGEWIELSLAQEGLRKLFSLTEFESVSKDTRVPIIAFHTRPFPIVEKPGPYLGVGKIQGSDDERDIYLSNVELVVN